MSEPGSCLLGNCRFLGWVVLLMLTTPSRLRRQPLLAGAKMQPCSRWRGLAREA